MRVLLFIDSLGAGGAERSTAVMLPYLRERGVEVEVATLYRAAEGSEDAVRADGFTVTVLDGRSFAARVRSLRRLLRERRPDVLHTSLYAADQIGRVAAAFTRVRVVTSLVGAPRDPQTQGGPGGPAPWKIRVVNAIDVVTSHLGVDRFHSVSPGVATMYQRAYRLPARRIVTVERGRVAAELGVASDDRRRAMRASLGLPDDAVLVLAAGRIDRQKAHEHLVAAFGVIAERHPSAHLLIAGRAGDNTTTVDAAIAALGTAGDRVHLLGFRSDIGDLLAASDVMVLSSRNEGTAGIVLEAMAIGVPIVSTVLPGLEGVLVDGHNARLVPVGDVAAMAAATTELLTDGALADRLVAQGRDDFAARFDMARNADRMVELYRQVVDRG